METIISKVRAEIERRITDNTFGAKLELIDILAWLDTLESEKPMNKDCNDCPHCVDRKDQYGWHFKGCFGGPYNGKFIAEIDECPLKQGQPEVDLEKPMNQDELENEAVSYCFDNGLNLSPRVATDFARHFAQWGAEHAKK